MTEAPRLTTHATIGVLATLAQTIEDRVEEVTAGRCGITLCGYRRDGAHELVELLELHVDEGLDKPGANPETWAQGWWSGHVDGVPLRLVIVDWHQGRVRS